MAKTNKKNKSKEEFDRVFSGVYNFDSEDLQMARKLQIKGDAEKAIEEYNKIARNYETELAEVLNIKPESSTTFVSPLVILEESEYEAGLKQKAHVEELAAKIYLAKAMSEELSGRNPENSLKKSLEHYKNLGASLESLAGTCSPYEDIAEIMFRSEANSAYKAASLINEKITGEILRVNNFRVSDWYTYSTFFSSGKIGCPDQFTASITGKANLEKIVEITKEKIRNAELPSDISSSVFESIFTGSDRCIISSVAYDAKTNVAGFVILQEIGLVGGRSWQEGCYGIKIDNKKLKGRLLRFNKGFYTHTFVGGEESENEGSRLFVHDIQGGILNYVHKTKYVPENKWKLKYDLKKL